MKNLLNLRQAINGMSVVKHSSNAFLSITAMALSSMTTYLTFFDSRYTMTTAVAGVEQQVQRGYSSSDAGAEVSFRQYVTTQMIISNRGTRPLVLSDVALVRSSDQEKCVETDDVRMTRFTSKIVEPGTVEQLPFEFSLPPIDKVADAEGKFDLSDDTQLWCMKWTVFDPEGERREPISQVFVANRQYTVDEDGYPAMNLKIEHSYKADRLVSRAIF